MADIPIDKLFFAYWTGPKQISRSVVPIKNTPHFRFAVQAINVADPEANLPVGTGYGRYARWETYCFLGRTLQQGEQPMHSERFFATNVKLWKQRFDANYHIQVLVEPSGSYVIDDGAHRAAFWAAAGGTSIKATIKPMPPNTYNDIDANALTVEKIAAMHNTIPPS